MQELEAGITYVNAPTIGAEVQLPFGGTKETGPTDTREAGTTALEEFTYWKTIYVDYSGRLQKAQIDTERLVGGGLPPKWTLNFPARGARSWGCRGRNRLRVHSA